MPENLKAKCRERQQPFSEMDKVNNADEKYGALVGVESSGEQTVKKPTKSRGKKPVSATKLPEKTVPCEFEEETVTGIKTVHRYSCSFSDQYDITKLIETKKFSKHQAFQLNIEALKIKHSGKIENLIALDALKTKLIPYNFQMHTALRVINEMNGNAILADEVGLGKTIEAGLIMKELLLRGEINSILIISPKSLLSQWKSEISEKFGETFSIANIPRDHVNFESDERIICSHNLLARKFDEIARRTWDLVVVDEAHTFRNTHSKGRACLGTLRKNHFLLLTATPLCNKLTDLYSIVDLIQPGVLDSERAFISRFAEDAKSRVVKSEEIYHLKQYLRDVMCRTRREQTGIPFTKRCVDSRTLEAETSEREFIDQATEYLRDVSKNHFRTIEALIAENPSKRINESQTNAILIFQAITLQQSFSSSPDAAIESLKRRQQRFPMEAEIAGRLIEMAAKVQSAKTELLKNVLKEIPNEQALIFCLRKITCHQIKKMLDQEFGKAAVYLGDLDQAERDKVIESFKRGETKYLVATDAAAEGLNLQNCCVMFNYDLHWNPMKIEQRIGRIHRFQQDRDVTIFNLSIKDTIDDYIIHILYQKIELFIMTIGKMETVLAELKEGSQDIQKTIVEILLRSNSRIDIKKELEKLAEDLVVWRKNQELAEKFTQGVRRLNAEYSSTLVRSFIKAYVELKGGKITDQSDKVFTIAYPKDESPREYTYQSSVAREKKILLLTPGSPAFQQILKECLENGVLCQVLLSPKDGYETLVKGYFKEAPFSNVEGVQDEAVSSMDFSPRIHRINNGKIVSVIIVKKEPARYFQFYFSATFQNKLRPRNEEIIIITLDEDCNIVSAGDSIEENFLNKDAIEIVDFKSRLEPAVFDKLKIVAKDKLNTTLKQKLVLFDLPLEKEKKSKLRSFDKRLRRERREKVISRKHDFDVQQWHANHEALLKREEESYLTNIAVKFINLLVINTTKLKFEATLDNDAAIRSSLILGIDHACEVVCLICRKHTSEGYATEDSDYVCGNCTKQSIDTGKIYSKKAPLTLDETLNEYFEHDSGFVCAVCGKRHSRLLEFKCSHDNSSVCINHYDFCDICGKVFSKANLTYTDEFKRKLCPKHATKNRSKEK